MIDREKLDSVIEFLEKTKEVKFNPYPVYGSEINAALSMLPTDKNYVSNHDKLGNKKISSMNRDEIATMLTFIARGERFCDGYIASFVESGELLQLMLRLRELEEKSASLDGKKPLNNFFARLFKKKEK